MAAPSPAMRFPKTVQLDLSDWNVFDRTAEPGEWAVSGAFAFANADPETLDGKPAQAFRNGFLGVGSFGRATFVMVGEIGRGAYDEVVDRLAAHFVDAYGAPDLDAARPAAREEAAFAASLCDHPVGTLITVERSFGPDGLVERFRTVDRKRADEHARIWEIVADDDA